MSYDRRTFLKLSAMTAATALLEGDEPVAGGEMIPPAEDGVTWNKAPCRFCGTGCQVQVGVKNGHVVGITGDRQAAVNKGLLCVKGYHVGGILYGEDRLTKPMKRVGDDFVAIEWDEALNLIADRIEADQDRFAFYGSGQWTVIEGFVANKFMKGGLSNNHIDPNARLCMASAATGFLATFGVDEPAGCYDDYDHCDVAIMWGNNPAEMHPVLWSRLIDRRLKGESVTVVDMGTRRTRTTELCDRFIQMKPHGDLAIALGIMNELVQRNTWDRSFVEQHCSFRKPADGKLTGDPSNYEEFVSLLSEYTLERSAELAGIQPDDMSYLADLFANPKLRILSSWCMGMNQHTRGTAINCLVHSLHMFSGHWGKPGDNAFSLTGQPSACGTAREVGTLAHALPGGMVVAKPEHREKSETFWNLPPGRINEKPGFHTVKMWEEFCTADGGINTVWVQVTNPGQSLPNLAKLFNGLRKEGKFLIVSDVYPTATTKLADLILPSSLWIEKNGVFGNSERRTHQWFKMVEPPGEARDDAWQIIKVARILFDRGHQGMRDKDGQFLFTVRDEAGSEIPAWDWAHWYDVNVDKYFFEQYRPFTRVKHKDLAPYEEYVKARGLRWPVVEQTDGTWRETKYRFMGFDDPYVAKGKDFDFYHGNDHDGKAYIWFHPYAGPAEVPDADYPIMLCTGRVIEHWHTGSMTMRVPQLQRAMPHAYVEMNRVDADNIGVRNGGLVIVESRRGSVELPVWVDGRGNPPPGSAFIPFFDERLMVNNVTLDAHDPFSKEPDYKKSAVRIRRK